MKTIFYDQNDIMKIGKLVFEPKEPAGKPPQNPMRMYDARCPECGVPVAKDTGICIQCGWSFDEYVKANPEEFSGNTTELLKLKLAQYETILLNVKTAIDADFLSWPQEWNEFMSTLHHDIDSVCRTMNS